MAIRFVEQIERWCCQPQDLKEQPNSPPAYQHARHPKFKVCKICGQQWEFYTYTDAAGSTDWDYREVKHATT